MTSLQTPQPLPAGFFAKLQAGQKQTAIVYGTSLSHTAEWPKALDAWLQKEFPGQITFVNGASSGKQSDWGVKNLSKRVLRHKPDLVFLEFSMNDSATKHQISQEQALANLDTMVNRLRAENPEVDLVLQVMNPVFNGSDGKSAADARPDLEAYYDGYRRYAKANGLPLIDHYPDWDELRRSDPEKYQRWMPDGTHPIREASLAVTWTNIRTFLERVRTSSMPPNPTTPPTI